MIITRNNSRARGGESLGTRLGNFHCLHKDMVLHHYTSYYTYKLCGRSAMNMYSNTRIVMYSRVVYFPCVRKSSLEMLVLIKATE